MKEFLDNILTKEDLSFFAKKLLAWYHLHKRALPWRATADPYKIWLSEVILQQTRVAQGLPYYERFVKHYPTVQDLAQASEQEILRQWQGLGYYTRARNLHACARYVVKELGGVFPNTYVQLCKLPGIGPYTAAAIASIAFGQAVAVVDGNVYRVLARIFGIQEDIQQPATQKKFRTLANLLLSKNQPGDYNQALMEFGALHCTPAKPACHHCIWADICKAKQLGQQDTLPVKLRKTTIQPRYFHYLILQCGPLRYLQKRTQKDIWRGLYEFYLIEETKSTTFEKLTDELALQIRNTKAQVKQYTKHYLHQLTHQRIIAHFFHLSLTKKNIDSLHLKNLQPYTPAEINHLPLPTLLVNFLNEHPQSLE